MINNGLYLVVGTENCTPHNLETVVRQAVQGGVKLLQLREKTLSTREFLEIAKTLKPLLTEHQVPLIINDRLDIAQASEADGVHLGQSDMPYEVARKILGYEKIIGLSVESLSEAKKTKSLDTDYIALSPIFSTPTKTNTKIEWGYEGLKKVRAFSNQPIVAIGGIHLENISDVLNAGADIIAVVSAISQSNAPKESATLLQEKIEAHFSSAHRTS